MAILALSTTFSMVQVSLSVGAGYSSRGHGTTPVITTALIDTGATITAISSPVRSALQPQQIGTVLYQRPGQAASWVPSYLVQLDFMTHPQSSPQFNLEVIEVNPDTPGIDVLLGQDLLEKVVMVWDGPRGRLLLTY
jgi:hypothetical protein